METESEEGCSVHVEIDNIPLAKVMMDEEREEENERERVERVRDPLGMANITSSDVKVIAGFELPK
jgi:hypothetical protein